MPIYEYLCPHCNRVFNFLAKSHAETVSKPPVCPKCKRGGLRKLISKFAVTAATRKSKDEGAAPATDTAAPPTDGAGEDRFDDPRVEAEMTRLLDAADSLDENDPRQLGRLMRRMTEISGEPLDPAMSEAVRRLESGEDPEKIEDDMGDLLGDEDAEGGGPGGPPSHDDGLYSL
ncbi:MAG: Zinc ribbon domain protein [Lentisphaerae bacterium ADurb.BinA184]|nr:MAG: Zinc ribbon domain protein [Lentisphaerae bacterium ADurb.BinA184]